MGESLRILIAVHDATERDTIHRALQQSDWTIEWTDVSDGDEALAQLQTGTFDCVLIEARIPPQDGLAVLRESHARGIEVPFVLLIDRGDERQITEAVHAGALDSLLKTHLSTDTLMKSIQYAVQTHQTRQTLKWLASFPEQAPMPIVEVDRHGTVTFMNTPAAEILQDISAEVLQHPFLMGLEDLFPALDRRERLVIHREARVENRYYYQTIATLPEHQAIRIYAMDITDRRRLEDQLMHQALHDDLTGLPNRALLMERIRVALARAERYPEYRFALLFLDLDLFKVINDSMGHAFGDRLLCKVAERIRQCVRPQDLVARFGGDEFVVLLEDLDDIREAVLISERIQQAFEASFEINGYEIFTSVSVGIAVASGAYHSPEDMIRAADTAMYRAKALGRARSQVFDEAIRQQVLRILQMETDLRHALARSEFHLLYQPIVDLHSGQPAGFEALLRWTHPQLGRIPPDEFIPVAEDTGVIHALGDWVLHTACSDGRQWQDLATAGNPLMLNINLSGRQFSRSDLAEDIRTVLASTGLDPERIVLGLEITERTFMENVRTSARVLHTLQQAGIRIYIDDFGTGYSSLHYLRRFPIDTLKIDASFIRDMLNERESFEIVRAIIALAHNLGLRVVAEGVETREQYVHLKDLGCDYGQGFFFAPPVPLDRAIAYLHDPIWRTRMDAKDVGK